MACVAKIIRMIHLIIYEILFCLCFLKKLFFLNHKILLKVVYTIQILNFFGISFSFVVFFFKVSPCIRAWPLLKHGLNLSRYQMCMERFRRLSFPPQPCWENTLLHHFYLAVWGKHCVRTNTSINACCQYAGFF